MKQALSTGGASARGGGLADLGLPPWPKVDFAKFGPIETQAAHAHPEDLGARAGAQLGDDPARHAVRRGGHHRARGLPRARQRGERQGRGQGVAARLPDEGGGRGAEEIPDGQQLPRRREPDPQALLAHRLRRRHAARARGAGDQGRRQERDPRHRARRPASSPRRRATASWARPTSRADLHDLVAGRHRRHRLHADHQRARGRHPGRLPIAR